MTKKGVLAIKITAYYYYNLKSWQRKQYPSLQLLRTRETAHLWLTSILTIRSYCVPTLSVNNVRKVYHWIVKTVSCYHCILHLTPTYMFVLFFYWFLTVHLGREPLFFESTGPDCSIVKSCESYWWTNLLYINNFYPIKFDDQCMGWAWYLANNMQFFVISPLFLILLYTWYFAGLIAIIITLLSSFGVTDLKLRIWSMSPNCLKFLVELAI